MNVGSLSLPTSIGNAGRDGQKITSSEEVRCKLAEPSLDSLLRQRRLAYLPRVLLSGPRVLQGLLQSRSERGPPAWVALVRADLQRLQHDACGKLAELGDPICNAMDWAQFMIQFPKEWLQITRLTLSASSDQERQTKPASHAFVPYICTFQCVLCTEKPCFPSAKSLGMHMRIKHGIRESLQSRIGDISICPGCHTQYHSRARLLRHLTDKRRAVKCRELVNTLPLIPDDLYSQLTAKAADERKEARKVGMTHPLAIRSATKADGRRTGRTARA